jgi:hypothetical protein
MDKTYKNGTPKKTGWYLCRYDGEDLPLKCYFCARKGMWQWISKDGYILTDGVTWSEPCAPLD